LYQKAAEQGHAAAQNNLGYCYQNGIRVEDVEKAIKRQLNKVMLLHRIILAIAMNMQLG